jgi:hypothetical protein
VYSLGLNNAPPISFTLIKSRVKNMQRFKQPVSRCKMAGAGFHSISKLRAQIFNPVMAVCGVYTADCHNENGHTADCQIRSLNLRTDCHRPELSAWFVLGLRAGVGNPQSFGKRFAEELLLLWQSAE